MFYVCAAWRASDDGLNCFRDRYEAVWKRNSPYSSELGVLRMALRGSFVVGARGGDDVALFVTHSSIGSDER